VDLQEHVLREIVRLRSIRGQPQHHPVHEILVAVDQLAERRGVGPGAAAFDQGPFVEICHPPPALEREGRSNVSRG
jgi:hypothetical protein